MKNLRLTPDFFRLHAMPKAGVYFAALFFGEETIIRQHKT